MGVIATNQVTLVDVTDVKSVVVYYLKQNSSLTPPLKPQTNPPSSPWATTEPSYRDGEDSILYTVTCTTFSNNTFEYSDVSVSSSFEAAKQAYSKANSASAIAGSTMQHFWTDDNGVHVASEASNATATRNTLWNSLGMLFRKGANAILGILTGNKPSVVIYDGFGNLDSNIVASFSADGVVIGLEDGIHSRMENDGFGVAYANDRLFDVSTNGFFTNIYMGGSTHATGCKYTNIQVEQTVSFLEGCTVSGTSILDPYGADTGYTLTKFSVGDFYDVVDADGDLFSSASYGGIVYWPDDNRFEADLSLEPLEEVLTAQAIISMGGVGVSAYDNILDVDAETIKVSKKRTNGITYGDILISEDKISFGAYDGGTLWYRSSLYCAEDGQRGTLCFDSGAPYGGQIGISNYDNAGNDLYTGITNIDGIGDGTITGAIASLVPTITTSSGHTVSLANDTPTTVASVALRKGTYILTGAIHYANNATGTRTLRFSLTDGGASADNCGAVRIQAITGGRTVMVHTWPCQIDNDGTTVYLVGNQDSGGALSAYNSTIKIVALDGGGIYAAG